jgi:hypothetical protein
VHSRILAASSDDSPCISTNSHARNSISLR